MGQRVIAIYEYFESETKNLQRFWVFGTPLVEIDQNLNYIKILDFESFIAAFTTATYHLIFDGKRRVKICN